MSFFYSLLFREFEIGRDIIVNKGIKQQIKLITIFIENTNIPLVAEYV